MQAILDHLVAGHAVFGPLIARIGPPRPVVEPREPYEALVRSIAHQQLHGNAARAILGRFGALYAGERIPPPAGARGAPEEAMRACGFSASKVAAIRDICANALDGTVPTLGAGGTGWTTRR